MSATSATLAGRAAAERLMVDACTIIRPSSGHTTDPTTGKVTYTGATIYAGKCRFQSPTGTRGDELEQAGERAFSLQEPYISVPMTVVGLRVGDVVTCTASLLDPDLVGTVVRVTAIARKTHLTARRLIGQEVTA